MKIPKITLDEKAKKILFWIFLMALIPLAFRSQVSLPYYNHFFFFLVFSFLLGVLLIFSSDAISEKKTKNTHSLLYLIAIFGVAVAFIGVTFGFPFFYSGSYIDEYLHIYSGIELFQSGQPASIYEGGQYTRGLHISALVGFFFFLFGESLLVAKMMPAILGCLSFIFFFLLARMVLHQKWMIVCALVLFFWSPFLLFNHFYIRAYVLHEMLFLGVLLLGCMIIFFLRQKKRIAGVFSVLGILFIDLIIVLFGNHSSGLPVVFSSGLVFSYLFLFESHRFLSTKNSSIFLRFFTSQKKRLMILLGIWILASVVLWKTGKLDFFLKGDILYGSQPGRNYFDLFFGLLPVFTIFFLLSFFVFFQKYSSQNSCRKMIVGIGLVLLCIHLLSSKDIQIIRAITFFLPLFILIAIISVEHMFFAQKKFLILSAGILFLCSASAFPKDFFAHPYLPLEQGYVDYQKAYMFIEENCDDKIVIETALVPYAADFYGVRPDYIFVTTDFALQNNIYSSSDNTHRLVFNDVPVITDGKYLVDITEENGFCYVQRILSLDLLIDPDEAKKLTDQAVQNQEFININVYIK